MIGVGGGVLGVVFGGVMVMIFSGWLGGCWRMFLLSMFGGGGWLLYWILLVVLCYFYWVCVGLMRLSVSRVVSSVGMCEGLSIGKVYWLFCVSKGNDGFCIMLFCDWSFFYVFFWKSVYF